MTDVLIKRELLERLEHVTRNLVPHLQCHTDLVAALAAPRQPKGEGLEVVAYQSIDATRGGGWMAHKHALPQAHIDQGALQEPLCRLSDAQRAIAELDRKVWEWSSAATAEAHRVDELKAERDTLRQQLAERDATIERLEAGIPRIQEQSHQMRKQRDKLAGLLADVKADYTHAIHWEDLHATMKRIDAALAEVEKAR